MRLALVPRTDQFYDLFTRAADNALAAARLAEQRFREFPDGRVRQSHVKELEVEGDRLTRDIIQLLNTQYVTPFDREDIFALARALDDVVDNIEYATDLLGLYKVETAMDQAIAQCRVLVGAAENLAAAIRELRRLRGVDHYLVQVKQQEDEGDRLVRDAVAALFENEGIDPLIVIRWKDIFDALEQAIDACETAAHFVANVVVKNA